jgi:putative aldouronate transport system substrate-binding protein
MTKKIFAVLAVIMLLAPALGCGPAVTATPTTAPVATTAPTVTMGPPVMLDYYQVGNADSTSRAKVEAAIDAYIEPLINADVTFHIIPWGDWASKAVTALEAGEKMDIIFTADWENYMQEVSEGLLVKMNDNSGPNGNLMDLYGQGILSTLNPGFISGSQIDGVTYAVPTQKELAVPWGYVYNVTVADEIGFTDADALAVKTYADLEPWLAKAKLAHPAMFPYLTDGTVGSMQWVHGFVSSISDYVVNMSAIPVNGVVDETIMDPMETPWMATYLAMIRTWEVKGYINPDAGLSTFQTSDALNAGNFFVEPMPLKGNNIKAVELMLASGNADLKLKEIYGMPKVINTSDAGGSMLAIAASSPNPVQAMKYINLMHTDSTLVNMMLYGAPDMWTVGADGRVTIVDDTWIKAMPGAWVLGDINLQKVTTAEDPNKNALLISYAADAFAEPSLGFRFRPESVQAEITAIQSVVDGSQRALLTGFVDPATELAPFIQSLKDAGLEKVLTEVRAQYTAWKASK